MDAKDIWNKQQSAKLAAAMRSGKTGLKLLDDADNNIGNATVLQPIFLPPGGPLFVKKPSNDRARLLNLTSDSKFGQSITVIMTAARFLPPGQNTVPGNTHAGPITGIIEFGNGSQFSKVEFDIPIGPFQGDEYFGINTAYEFLDGGVAIQVPTGTLRVFARYDNALIWPMQAVGSPAYGEPPIVVPPGCAPLAPNPVLQNPGGGLPVIAPVMVKAFANYFGRVFSRLQKTMYVYVSDTTAGGCAFNATYAIPSYARAVRVVRIGPPTLAALEVTLWDRLAFPNTSPINYPVFTETHTIAAGTLSPLIPIEGYHTSINVRTAGVADKVFGVKLVFDIGF